MRYSNLQKTVISGLEFNEIPPMGIDEKEERIKAIASLDELTGELFNIDFIHDCVVENISIKNYRANRLPEVKIKLSIGRADIKCTGTLVYKGVSKLTNLFDICDKGRFENDCLYDELYLTDGNGFAHNIIFEPNCEVNIECESIKWVPQRGDMLEWNMKYR